MNDEEKRFRPSKKLGQSFLVDTRIAERIAKSANLQRGEVVLEIGPGKGILTRCLLDTGAFVLAIEKDYRLYEELLDVMGANPNVQLECADVLDLNIPELLAKRLPYEEKAQVVSNLPYSITGPAIFRLLDASERISKITLMLQREVVDRIVAKPGSKDYSSLSAGIALHGKAKMLFTVGAGAFRPRPRVQSAVVQIEMIPIAPPGDLAAARRVVRAAFTRRRKQLRNSLLESGIFKDGVAEVDRMLAGAGISPEVRAETLKAEDFLKLARGLES